MNSEEYIQTIRASFKAAKHIEDIELILPYLDELRKYHLKFQQELEYLLVDPNSYETKESKDLIQARAIEIKELCIAAGLQYRFFKLPLGWSDFHDQFKAKVFATYNYKGQDITDLVVYSKRDKNKIKKIKSGAVVGMIEEKEITLAELKFTEEPKEKSFITENNDLPTD